jgi:phage-related protein
MQTMKSIVWMGGSRRDLTAMPEGVKKDFGGALHGVQLGNAPEGAKQLKGKCKGATQLSEDHDGETYRAVYTTELEGTVYVLHCFHKKSKSGIATPQPDLDLIESRLKDAKRLHEIRSKKADG